MYASLIVWFLWAAQDLNLEFLYALPIGSRRIRDAERVRNDASSVLKWLYQFAQLPIKFSNTQSMPEIGFEPIITCMLVLVDPVRPECASGISVG